MKTKAMIVMMSHLSDVQDSLGFGNPTRISSERINFVKFLILKYPDTNTEIDPDKEWEEFKK